MALNLTPFSLIAIALAIVTLTAAIYIWYMRSSYGSAPLLLLTLAAAQWSLCFGLEIAGADVPTKLFWAKAQWLGLTLAPVLWLATAARGSGDWPSVLGGRRWLLWFLLPPLIMILVATNELHGLVWSEAVLAHDGLQLPLHLERGAFFWVNAFFAIGLCLLVTLLAIAAIIRLPMFRRRYAAAVLAGTALPWFGNVLYLAGLDLAAPLSYWLGGLTLSWGLYQIRLLNLVPIARSAIVESLPDGVMVLDDKNCIIDCNPAALQLLNTQLKAVLGRRVTEVLPARPDLIERYGTLPEAQDEIVLNERICELRIAPMSDRLGRPTGRLIMVRDVTERVRSADELDQRTAELQTILQAFPDLMFRLDDNGRFLGYTASPQARLFSQPHEFLGRRIDEVLPDPIGRQLLDALLRVRLENAPQALDYSLLADDQTHWYEARLFPTRRREVIGVVRDVTERKQAETELREQKELLENLVAVARATSEQPALEATLENVMQVGVNLTSADRGSLFLLNPAGEVTQTVSVSDDASATERRAVVERLMQDGLAGWVVRERQTALVTDTTADDRWLPLPRAYFTGSALAVPILSEQSLLGVLILTHTRPQHFTADHVRLMEAAADQMALAVRNARLFEVQRRMAERQTTLYEVLRAVSGQLNAEVIAQTAAEAIAHFAGWPHVALLLADNDHRHWVVRAISGAPSLPLGFTLPIAPEVLRNGAFTSLSPESIAENSDLSDPAARASDVAHLVVPLWHGGSLIGVLNIEGHAATAFDADDLSLAQSLADAVALALDNAHLYEYINDERSRLQASIRFNRDGIALLGMTQRILVINAQALRLLGLPGEPEEWLNRPIAAVIRLLRWQSPPVVKAIISEIRRAQRGDEPPAEGEYEVASRVVHWTSLPVLSNAQPIGRLIVLRDVTEEHQLNAMREDLTSTMVHDLRNPATVVLGALELLEGEDLTESQREITDVASQGGQRLLNLINAILDVNRLESGQMPLEREPVRLDIIAAEIVEMEQVLARDKQLTLENCVSSDLPLVSVDVELLRRVMQNLIGNAIKFTPPEGHIVIKAQLESANPPCLRVSIMDDGHGLAPELQARLFQKFVTGRVRGRGSGLGLAFCRLVMEAHGGRIWVESAPGQGATFHFTLPLAED
ncbi:two-component system, NarL family, sensor histidine kinase EvgS [Thermoflexales bacterium]|nr:two-component system, NarL family, sensor histidine kinase EvgS [Thermoflexales bacterium]